MPVPFERSAFINCPFDAQFAPILQAIAFCVWPWDSCLGWLRRMWIMPRGGSTGFANLSAVQSSGYTISAGANRLPPNNTRE